MENNEYLDFDEAVRFLRTTPSTLYKWLQAGKVPGHKLGRQWRFLKEELELHISGKAPKIQLQKEALSLAELLKSRASEAQETKVTASIQELSESLIWDAFDHGSRLIHIYPSMGRYEISYRTRDGLERLTTIQEDFFDRLDLALRESSAVVRGEDSRRIYLQRNEDDAVQVRYQKVDTVTGARITLRLWQPQKDVMPLEKIVDHSRELTTMKNWLEAPHGIIVVTGVSGSGKTTTLYSMLNELKVRGGAIFTLEDPAEMVIDGINQVELKGRRPEDFERAFDQIYSSDPDVICFGLGSNIGLEHSIYLTAFRAASTGHLVLVQMDSPSCELALVELKKHVAYPLDHLVVGISCQQLNAEGKKRVAQYDLYEPARQ